MHGSIYAYTSIYIYAYMRRICACRCGQMHSRSHVSCLVMLLMNRGGVMRHTYHAVMLRSGSWSWSWCGRGGSGSGSSHVVMVSCCHVGGWIASTDACARTCKAKRLVAERVKSAKGGIASRVSYCPPCTMVIPVMLSLAPLWACDM